MLFEVVFSSIFNSGEHLVQWSGTVLAVQGHKTNITVILKSSQ